MPWGWAYGDGGGSKVVNCTATWPVDLVHKCGGLMSPAWLLALASALSVLQGTNATWPIPWTLGRILLKVLFPSPGAEVLGPWHGGGFGSKPRPTEA